MFISIADNFHLSSNNCSLFLAVLYYLYSNSICSWILKKPLNWFKYLNCYSICFLGFFWGTYLIFYYLYLENNVLVFFIFLQVNSQRRTQWVFECSRAFIFGWRSGTDRNQSLETVASEKHYLIHRWVLFFIFCAKIEKIREIEVLNRDIHISEYLLFA